MNVTINFNGTDRAVVASFEEKGPKITSALMTALNRSAIGLQAHIVADKLQGQVLHQRTGKLIGSIRVVPARAEGTGLRADVEGGGGVAPYGRVHEYGGTFTYLRPNKKRAFGTHVTATYPERSFMRSSLEDMRSDIKDALQQAVSLAVNS